MAEEVDSTHFESSETGTLQTCLNSSKSLRWTDINSNRRLFNIYIPQHQQESFFELVAVSKHLKLKHSCKDLTPRTQVSYCFRCLQVIQIQRQPSYAFLQVKEILEMSLNWFPFSLSACSSICEAADYFQNHLLFCFEQLRHEPHPQSQLGHLPQQKSGSVAAHNLGYTTPAKDHWHVISEGGGPNACTTENA